MSFHKFPSAGDRVLVTAAQSAFISYSRDDSEFALRLAEDLKAAGAAVWLDQLDIAPGQRWANAVQDALASCPRLLVILSPSSVGSTNVDDEVSFALEERKTVIPVLYRECKIPFRLRPLQYVDFRSDYARGLTGLLGTLPTETQRERIVPTPKESQPSVSEESRHGTEAPQARLEEENGLTAEQVPTVQEQVTASAQEHQPVVSEEAQGGRAAGHERLDEEHRQIPADALPEQEDQHAAEPSSPVLFETPKQNEVFEKERSDSPKPSEPVSLPIPTPASSRQDADDMPGERNIDRPAWASLSLSRGPIRLKVAIAVCGILIAGLILYGVWARFWKNTGLPPTSVVSSKPQPRTGAAVHTEGGGGTWKAQNDGTREGLSGPREGLSSAAFLTSQSGWAVGSHGIILHTEDGGASWRTQRSGTGSLFSVVFLTPRMGWAVGWAMGSHGIILHTEDGGASWRTQRSGTRSILFSIVFLTPRMGWAVGSHGIILHTEDGGASWRTQRSGTGSVLRFVIFPTPQLGWVVGQGGTILHTEDGGASWRTQRSGTREFLVSAAFVTPQSGWAVGSHGIILHTEDGGDSWQTQSSGTGSNLNSVVFPTPRTGWAVGQGGVILHTEDGGDSWQTQSSGTGSNLNSVAFPTPRTGWAVGRGGTILHWH